MIDLKLLRENPELIRKTLQKRGAEVDLDEIINLDKSRRACITELQELKQQRNTLSEEIGKLKRQGQQPEKLMEQARTLAIANAKRKAEAMAKEMGGTLGRVMSISDRGSRWQSTYGNWGRQHNRRSNVDDSRVAEETVSAISGTMRPGQIAITMHLQMAFELDE